MALTSTINTIPAAKALASQLSAQYSFEKCPIFKEGRVVDFVVRLEKKDYRGVVVGSLILGEQGGKDFLKSIAIAKDEAHIQRLTEFAFGRGH